jgi:hypothetical protein
VGRESHFDVVCGASPERLNGCYWQALADDAAVAHLGRLASLTDATSARLLSEVAHRERLRLVPLFDRDIIDLCRPVTGRRGAAARGPLLRALRADLAEPANCDALTPLRPSPAAHGLDG